MSRQNEVITEWGSMKCNINKKMSAVVGTWVCGGGEWEPVSVGGPRNGNANGNNHPKLSCLRHTKVPAQLAWNLDGGATKIRTRYQVPGTFFGDGNAKKRRGELRWYCRWKRGKTILTNNCPSPGENSWLCSSFPLACFPIFQFSAAFSLPPAVRETKYHIINPIKQICPTLYNCVVDILFEVIYLFLLFLVFCRFGIKVLLQSSPGGFQGLLPSHDQSWIFTWEKPCVVNSTS